MSFLFGGQGPRPRWEVLVLGERNQIHNFLQYRSGFHQLLQAMTWIDWIDSPGWIFTNKPERKVTYGSKPGQFEELGSISQCILGKTFGIAFGRSFP